MGRQKSAKLMANACMVHMWTRRMEMQLGRVPANAPLGGVTGGTTYSTGAGYNTSK